MRKKFAELLFNLMNKNENIILLTGDLGYGLWDKIKLNFPDRFYNVGSAEVLMMGMATGMALENKIPVVYSITPFLIYRPYELIRNYLDHENLCVKLIGGGRDKDYGSLGFSHWACEDKEALRPFKNITISHPNTDEELVTETNKMFSTNTPFYMNLKK